MVFKLDYARKISGARLREQVFYIRTSTIAFEQESYYYPFLGILFPLKIDFTSSHTMNLELLQ